MYNTFLKLSALENFLDAVSKQRSELLKELKDYGCDPVRRMRRIRMLSHLAQYEAMMIKKIDSFESDDIKEWMDSALLMKTVDDVTHRSA